MELSSVIRDTLKIGQKIYHCPVGSQERVELRTEQLSAEDRASEASSAEQTNGQVA